MTVYRVCTDRDIPQLKSMWLACFDEREEAAELFFQRNKKFCHAYTCAIDGRPVSALYLIDCMLINTRAHYLCGAATLPEYRGRGLMSALVDYALQDATRRGDRYSLLLPANDALYGFYARMGYLPACAEKIATLTADTDQTVCDGTPDLHALQTVCYGDHALIWNDDYIRFAADYYGCYGAKTARSANAFAIFLPDGDFAEVLYAAYSDIGELKALLRAEGIKRFRLTGAADSPLFDGEIKKPFGMIRALHRDPIPENVTIGITLQ